MKIAIPLAEGKLSMHFGHCAQFAIVDFDEAAKSIRGKDIVDAPPHEPGLLPKWLGEMGVGQIIAGGMGQRAQSLFQAQGINVIVGAPASTPEELVSSWSGGTLVSGSNMCDH